jgi:hydroxyacylglutathione hydrolase
MIVERSMDRRWLSNTYLVADRPGGHAVLIDTGAPIEKIVLQVEELKVTVTHALCTHHHVDHVLHNQDYRLRYRCPVCGHGKERELFGELDVELSDGDEIRSGDLHIRAIHVPGHTLGQLAFLVDGREVFTGDTLFEGSIGGTCAPGHTTFEDIRESLMETLMRLPKDTVVRPGHMGATTIEREWETNPFIRAFRGVDSPSDVPCTAFGRPATLLIEARDYDGGTKCWVRFDDGTLDVVPGSAVAK